MKHLYLNIYNNLVKLTRNKLLYNKTSCDDTFSTRLLIFFFHFAFFLEIYKSSNNKKEIQKIYDFIFKQIELSIREIGYGDVTINKKMKTYVNIFYSILQKTDKWDVTKYDNKSDYLPFFFGKDLDIDYFIGYFDKYRLFLLNKTFNYFTKDVISFKF